MKRLLISKYVWTSLLTGYIAGSAIVMYMLTSTSSMPWAPYLIAYMSCFSQLHLAVIVSSLFSTLIRPFQVPAVFASGVTIPLVMVLLCLYRVIASDQLQNWLLLSAVFSCLLLGLTNEPVFKASRTKELKHA